MLLVPYLPSTPIPWGRNHWPSLSVYAALQHPRSPRVGHSACFSQCLSSGLILESFHVVGAACWRLPVPSLSQPLIGAPVSPTTMAFGD